MVLLELIVDTQFIMLFLAGYLEEKFGQQCLLASKSVVPERRKSKEKEEQSFTHTKAKKARFKLYDRAGMLQACPILWEAMHACKLSMLSMPVLDTDLMEKEKCG